MKNRRGVTLVELVLTIALLGMAIQVIYSVFFVGSLSYSVSTNKGFSQQDIRLAATFVEKELKYSTDVGANLSDPNGYYSLEIIDNGDGKGLVKYFYSIDDKSTPDTTDDVILKAEKAKYSGNWTKFSFNNTTPGIIEVIAIQEEGSGKGKSDYSLEFSIDMLNNSTEVNAFTEIDLVNGDKLFYRNAPINLGVNSIHVKTENTNIGDTFRTITFKDSEDSSDYGTFTAKSGVLIEYPNPNPTKSGKNFLGWFTTIDETGIKFTAGSLMPDYDFILYAKWEDSSVTIPQITSVKITKIEAKNETNVSIFPSNSQKFKLEKNKLHSFTIEIMGNNLNKVSIKVNSTDPVIISSTSNNIVIKYSYTPPNNTGEGSFIIEFRDNAGTVINTCIFSYLVDNNGDY